MGRSSETRIEVLLYGQRVKERKKLKNDAQKAHHDAELARMRCVKDVAGHKKEVQNLKQDKDQALMQIEREKAQKQGRSVSSLRELEKSLTSLTAERQSAVADLNQKNQDMEVCKQTLDEARGLFNDKKSNLDRAFRDLQALQKSNASKLSLFGAHSPSIL